MRGADAEGAAADGAEAGVLGTDAELAMGLVPKPLDGGRASPRPPVRAHVTLILREHGVLSRTRAVLTVRDLFA